VSGSVPVSLATQPRYWPDENGAAREERPVRQWRVLHACDVVGATAAIAEAQIEAGMRPSVLTPTGWYRPLSAAYHPAPPLSLVHEWQQVRRWRLRFINESVDQWAEVLHAHCFSAAMAALRGDTAVVYDLGAPIGAGVFPRPGAWLLRSLRVAEQFALLRAGAVVTHSHAMWSEALRRGISTEDLFLVPEPVEAVEVDWSADTRRGTAITLFAAGVACAGVAHAGVAHAPGSAPRAGFARAGVDVPSRVLPDHELILQAFAMIVSEIENARLILEVAPGTAQSVLAQAAQAGVAASVDVIAAADRKRAMAEADIVIAAAPGEDEPGAVLISALAHGRAVLAADVAQNREVTPQGRGCLWYRNQDPRDLAGRAAFLARNPDFRAALGISGRAHLQATRSGKVVARKYDEVYRHAYQRRYRGGPDPLSKLEIVQACF
jgi:glycosyltransferase involved in cell wall biosynthesis